MKKVFYGGLLAVLGVMIAGDSVAAEKGLYSLLLRGKNHVERVYRDSTIRITADTTDEELAEIMQNFDGGRIVEEEEEPAEEPKKPQKSK